MITKFPSVAVGRVLGVMSCIFMLGMLTACGGGGSDSPEAQQFGRMTLRITDSPVTEAERVVVEFTGLEIKPVNSEDLEVFDFSSPRRIDLLALDGGGSEILLDNVVMPSGEYEWIRLKVNAGRNASDSFIELEDGSRHALFIPSGNQTGLKLIRGFTIGISSTHDFTIDFDLRKSVVRPPGQGGEYLLKPVLRLVNNLEVGTLDGHVDNALVVTDCEPAAYLYTGANVVPDDIGSATEPLATTSVHFDSNPGVWHFVLAFVPTGSYTVAFTCDADDDHAETDDAIVFTSRSNVSITAGQTTTVTLLPPP